MSYKIKLQKKANRFNNSIFSHETMRGIVGTDIWYKGKKYHVGRMSYGDYFFEPVKESRASRETDSFSSNTLWLYPKEINNQYGIKQFVLEVED
jgi:vesicle coat complex subunit